MTNDATNRTAEAETWPDFDYARAACNETQVRLRFLLERIGQVAVRLPRLRPVDRPSALAGICVIVANAEEALAEFRRVLEPHAKGE